MRKKYFYLITILSTLSIIACNKEDKDYVKAVVVDSGDLSSQGCGYLLQFEDGNQEKPYQLLSAYQRNGLRVKVKYHSSDMLDTCGNAKPASYYQLIIIDDIKYDSKEE